MGYLADLHLHSSFAFATSKDLTLENLAAWARVKGVDLLASAGFTHPEWLRVLSTNLAEDGPGLYRFGGVHFVLGTEVSCVYRQGGRSRRVHVLLLAPDFDTVDRINGALSKYGNLQSDGRPTLKLAARDLTALVLDINPGCIVIPAHVWTPWYGLFGSKSGFNYLEECFLDMSPQIHAVETGLSSDPAMNWGIPELENRTIVSFSDAHSAPNLGRELTAFQGELSYRRLADALANQGVAYSVEFYPEEGKYHWTGHRKCAVSQSPQDTAAQGTRCPVCHRPLTLGVLHQISEYGEGGGTVRRDPDGFVRSIQGRPPFIRLLTLAEIIAETWGRGRATKGVQREFGRITAELGGEIQALIWTKPDDLIAVAGEKLAEAVLRARMGDIQVDPGYDGVYGKIRIWPES